jgi:hypothetical protein
MASAKGRQKVAIPDKKNAYSTVIQAIFHDHYKPGVASFSFKRTEIEERAAKLGVKNLGDLIYSFRFRANLPDAIVHTAPPGMEWIIELHGKAVYQFRLVKLNRINPQTSLAVIDIPDATPEIVIRYTQSDEQALLAKLRYNRLIDVFLGITTYSLQNHLRTTVRSTSGSSHQIEIDELYVGIDTDGRHYVVPVQAKGGTDQLGAVQAQQDIDFCLQKFPDLECRPVSAQFLSDEVICLFELTIQGGELKVKNERHYKLCEFDVYEAKKKSVTKPRVSK